MAPNEKKPRPRKAVTPKAETAPKKTVTRARKPKAPVVPASLEVGSEHIAERAYFLWLNGADGDSNAHWLQAERELAAA